MTAWWQKTLAAAAGVAGLAGGLFGTYYALTHRPLPKRKGSLHLQGLHDAVEIITDSYGVPHVYAQSEEDMYFAQGYLHAQERLWQMEVNRRLGSGRLSEIFGPIAVETDRFCRRLGLHRASASEVARLSKHDKGTLEAYARGVNAFINSHRTNLPLEFTILRLQPEAWQITDSIQWSKMMGWNLGGNWETELIRAELVARLGIERASRLEAGYDPSHPLIVPPGVAYQGINLGMLEQYEQVKALSGFGTLGGSNNWVVDGTKTHSGFPILCNDPHLGQAAPSIWYECHLVAGDIDVVGASFPGTPGVVIGHNQHIAWGVTNAISDVQDLYIEKFHPSDSSLYEYQGQWEMAQLVREEIVVKGAETVVEEVRITRHGPILTTMAAPNYSNAAHNGTSGGQSEQTEWPMALRWTGLEQCNIISSIQKLAHATNWNEFRDALHDWDVPPQNIIYGDHAGNIGYVMAGAIPIRAKGQALLPSPGWTGEYEWTGYIPFEELPQTYNPAQHFIATANNRVIDDSYPYYITNEWLNGYRAQRIRDLLTRKDKLTTLDMANIQSDQYSIPASEIVPHMLRISASTPLERAALDNVRAWGYVLSPDSTAATIYSLFLRKLETIVFQALLGEDETLHLRYLGVGANVLASTNGYASRSRPLLIRLLNERDNAWFSDSAVPNGPRAWDAALSSAFQATIEELCQRFGDDIAQWQYGKTHKMSYNHTLGAARPLDRLFNRGPFPVGGDIDTVNMGATLPDKPEVVVTVPSYRQIVDLSDLSNSLSVHAPGQSGHPASKHYDDFIPLWLAVEHHPMLYAREMIEEQAEGGLQLLPEK